MVVSLIVVVCIEGLDGGVSPTAVKFRLVG